MKLMFWHGSAQAGAAWRLQRALLPSGGLRDSDRPVKRDSGHLRSLGFTGMKRAEFNALVAKASTAPGRPGKWAVDKSINVANGIRSQPSLA